MGRSKVNKPPESLACVPLDQEDGERSRVLHLAMSLSRNSTAKPVWKLDRENRAAVISPNDRRPSRKGDMRRPPQPVSENELEAPPFAPRGCRGHGDAVDHPSTSQGRKLHRIVRFETSPSRKGLLGDTKSRNPLPAIAWRQTDSLHHASRVRTLLAKMIVMR